MRASAMSVWPASAVPGTMRRLKSNGAGLLILTRGQDVEGPVAAELLPSGVGALVPPRSAGPGGEHFMALPLRDAREIFERDYLKAQINRFGGNISRTAEFVGMERSALHRKLKSLGIA